MLWRLDGQFALDDVLPVPEKKPGRHFTSGYQAVGKTSSPYEEKYAKMTYGEHYRKKVMQTIERERRRCAELLEEQKNHTSALKALKNPRTTPQHKAPRYNMNELRHHQRRCAALLFCARQRGAHELPVLVKWAPKRRESYYLMSERVYNDRLMMKLRNEEQSPLVFDFTEGETDDLHDLQKLIQSTSSHLKNMKLDTKFKDYDYNFEEGQKQAGNESGADTRGENGNEGGDSELSRAKRKVTFSDHVTHSDNDASFARSKSKRSSQHPGDLDPSDIEINFSSDGLESDWRSRTGDESEAGTSRSQRPGDESGSGNRFSSFRSHDSSLDLLSTLRGSSRFSDDDYSSDFTGSSTEDPGMESRLRGGASHLDWSADFDKSSKKLHNNPHCRHSLTRKAMDYYKKLPKLLKTSELREKLPKERLPKARELGHDVNHSCMEPHKTAYERALLLARYKTLPPSYSFLAGKTSRRPFSYFAGLPGTNKAVEFKGDAKPVTMEKKMPPRAEGRKAIFGDIDMNDFYSEEDELLYFINPEELKQVVASTVSTDESSRDEDGLTTASATTSRTTATNKNFSAYESETASGIED